jgi:uncharacterized protein (TIGR00290 family)
MSAERRKVLVAWSSGKDSAWALHVLQQRADVEAVGLLTTVNEAARRVSMHSTHEDLLEMQARAVGLPLTKAWLPDPCSNWLPDPCSNEAYERAMRGALAHAREKGVEAVGFGDLFLADVRRYREERLASAGMEALFPLWGLATGELARDMVKAGLRARVVCIDPPVLDRSFAGRMFGHDFLEDLPSDVDPCGERGEFHTFAFQGPMFRSAIDVEPGPIVERDGFVFADLYPREGLTHACPTQRRDI